MAAERPTATRRSRFGSSCATAAACLCLAYGFAGCLNPLTDDQPSVDRAPAPSVEGTSGGTDDNAGSGAPGVLTPGADDLTAEPESSPPTTGGSSAADAGVADLDAGPDSGSAGQAP